MIIQFDKINKKKEQKYFFFWKTTLNLRKFELKYFQKIKFFLGNYKISLQKSGEFKQKNKVNFIHKNQKINVSIILPFNQQEFFVICNHEIEAVCGARFREGYS